MCVDNAAVDDIIHSSWLDSYKPDLARQTSGDLAIMSMPKLRELARAVVRRR